MCCPGEEWVTVGAQPVSCHYLLSNGQSETVMHPLSWGSGHGHSGEMRSLSPFTPCLSPAGDAGAGGELRAVRELRAVPGLPGPPLRMVRPPQHVSMAGSAPGTCHKSCPSPTLVPLGTSLPDFGPEVQEDGVV